MWHIELVKNKYESLEDLYSLLQYVFRLNKTADDSRRANIITDDLTGCLPAMIPDINNPDMVYRLMLFIIQRRHKDTPQLVRHRLSKTDKSLDLTECQKIALHEAAHAVVGEILNPDSIGIVTIRGNQSCIGGFENGCSTYLKNEEELLNDITKTLAGKAGVSLIYGVMDVNASGDIQNANRLLDLWMTSLAGAGFSEVESANNRMSETRLFSSEAIRAAKMEELYRRAYKILYDNRDFLLAVQKELLEHETLLNSDLAKIWESCT